MKYTNPSKNKVGAIIQARMGSTRLPGKVLKKLRDKTLLEILLKRVKKAKLVDEIIVATTSSDRDKPIVEIAKKMDVSFFCGSEENVLERFFHAAKERELDTIVRITSDCPFTDPLLIDKHIQLFREHPGAEYVSNTLQRRFPRGFDIEIFSYSALYRAHLNAGQDFEKEHVTPYIIENFKAVNFQYGEDHSEFRVTVDTPEDLKLVNELFEIFNGRTDFSFTEVIEILKERDDLVALNAKVQQKEIMAP
ncbi:cytidylyltransferase domain-containing protein [Candidatus Riflebacteria bacterium]